MGTNQRKNLFILAFTLAVVMLGFGMVIPLFPFYIEKLGASGRHLGFLIAAYSLMQLIFAPFWGSLSDRLGRKPILMLGILGNALSLVFFGLATKLWMLFVARTLSGILSSATLPTTMAYVSDSTTAEERSNGIGKLSAAMGLGVILGPGVGGWLGTDSLATPFFIAAALSAAGLLLIALLLPESLPQMARAAGKLKTVDLGQLRQALFSPIGILLFMAFLVSFGLTNFEGIYGLYALEKLGYGPQRVGTILTVMGIVSTATQGALTGPLTRRLGEEKVIKLSLLASVAGFLLMLTASSFAAVLLTVGFFILTVALLRPAVMALTTRRTTMGQGAVLGLNNAFMSLGRIVGPIWAGFAFDVNFNYPYLSGAAIMFGGFLISLVWITSGVQPETAAATS